MTNNGTITAGTYIGAVTNHGVITDGGFQDGASVDNYGRISGGTFAMGCSTVTVESGGSISEGYFSGTEVSVNDGGIISGGRFSQTTVSVNDGGIISGGTFSWGAVTVSSGGIITGGIFEQGITVDDISSIRGRINGQVHSTSGEADTNYYYLTVINAGEGGTNSGYYQLGDVAINAGTRSGYTFTGWSLENEVGSIDDERAASTTYTMWGDATITANWEANASGDSGAGNSGNAGGTGYSDPTSDQIAGRSSSIGEDLDEASSDRENSESDKSTDPSTSVTSGAQTPTTDPMMVLVEAATEKLQKEKAGSTLVLDNKRWNSYSLYFMQELQKRRDLTVVIKYIYKNENYTVTIPAGQEIKLDEEILWYGPLKLASMFETEVTK